MMRRFEWLIGIGLGVLVYLFWIGVDLTPLVLIGGALGILYLLTQGRLGRGFETVGNNKTVTVDIIGTRGGSRRIIIFR